jgi:hypothetical protein
MRESCMYGSERGARGNSRPYRTRHAFITLLGSAAGGIIAHAPALLRRRPTDRYAMRACPRQ